MAFDGIITKIIVNELNNNILEAKIDKISVFNKSEVLLSFHKNKENFKLFISIDPTNARISLSSISRESPLKAPQFCMVLRKHLQGAKLLKIEQYQLDRIIVFTFENIDEFGDLTSKKLIVELMGKHSNIILVNSDDKIIDSIKHVDRSMSSLREILPAHEYYYPDNQTRHNFEGITLDNFISILKDGLSTPSNEGVRFSNILANEFTGFSRLFTNNLCKQLKIDNTLSKDKVYELYSTINLIFHNIAQRTINLQTFGNDYHIDLETFSTHDNSPKSNSDFLDAFYASKEKTENLENEKNNLKRLLENNISKLNKGIKRTEEILNDSSNCEKYKKYGELLTANMYKISAGMESITIDDFYNDNLPITIPLNPTFSPSRNVQNYFKKYTKLKSSISHASRQKLAYENEISYLETVAFEIDEAICVDDLIEIKLELEKENLLKVRVIKKKKENEVSSPISYIYNGTEILVGKNNLQNDKLTLKDAKKSYTWLHTKDIHGSHVIIKSENISEDLLLYAAKLAKEHSRAKNSSKVSVDYTLVKNVHKPSGSKAGMVIYTNYKTIII